MNDHMMSEEGNEEDEGDVFMEVGCEQSMISGFSTANIERMFVRNFELNEKTKRLNQTLTCRECNHKFFKLSNGKDHLRMHFK